MEITPVVSFNANTPGETREIKTDSKSGMKERESKIKERKVKAEGFFIFTFSYRAVG